MKNILYMIAVIFFALSCTKHDPFDNISDGDVWILSKFTADDVDNMSLGQVNFLPADTQFRAEETFYTHSQLKVRGILDVTLKDKQGKFYRLPTSGELMMAFPQVDPDQLPSGVTESTLLHFCWQPFEDGRYTYTEKAYLQNNSDFTANKSGETISGKSEFFYAKDYEDNEPDFFPIFALRFKGTSQYAAYRYEICQIRPAAGNFMGAFGVRLRAKKLQADDTRTKLSDITNEDYWKDCLELKFSMDGFYNDNGFMGNYDGRVMSSTLTVNEYGETVPVVAAYDYSTAGMITDSRGNTVRYPVRLLRCKATGVL